MKTNPSIRVSTAGNALLLTIFVTGLIGFVLAVYLTLVQSQNTANTRSQVWNSAMPIIEAGVEEALAHLNHHGSTNLNCDGWTLSGAEFRMTRAVGDGYYTVKIRNFTSTNSSPIIESYGYVVAPALLTSTTHPYVMADAVNGTTTGPSYIGRGVQVTTRQDFIFTKGMVAKDSIDLNGNNIRADSFDSLDTNYSSNGLYDSTRFKDNGDVAVNSSLTNSLSAGNADIYGHVATGPGGTIAVGPQGAIGSTNWHNSGQHGIQSGWSADDMNVSFPDVNAPFNGGAFTPTGGWITNTATTYSTNTGSYSSIPYPSVTGIAIVTNQNTSSTWPAGSPGPIKTNYLGNGNIKNYTYPVFSYNGTSVTTNSTTTTTYYDVLLTAPGNYQLANLSGSVYVSANVILYVTASLNISSMLIKAPYGKLALYSSAPSVALAGNTAANSDGTADCFSFWGMPSVTSISFSGNAAFTGTIYAPNANFQLNGGGNNTTDFIGASITKTAKMNGHFNFHYDEALRSIGPFRGFVINGWVELPPSSVPTFTTSTF